MEKARRPVAFFDSGLGGISVLRETRKQLPCEQYLYFGDSANAPYGTKSPAEVRRLSRAVMERMLEMGAKAVVIACNTATGMAIDLLREEYGELPIIGVEPAVKPAAEMYSGGRILVLATPLCLRGQRFQELWKRFSAQAEIVPIPCEGLMEFVERGELEGPALRAYLREKLAPWRGKRVDAAVLGCTHYPFLRAAIAEALGNGAEIIDGNAGIAAQLRRRLEERGLLNPGPEDGVVTFYNSLRDPAILELSRMLFALPDT
ncbi:MAG: glutamate racemase [Oscillospiraceae bacterium]|nr:glutamate racemase [Oscillospiraceae bacterium]